MKKKEPYISDTTHTYRTGSTNPPKSRRGLVTVLLILVILLATVSTLLSMMNVRLFRLLEQQNEKSLHFTPENGVAPASAEPSEGVSLPELGVTAQEVDDLYCSYHQTPRGIYITQVASESIAHRGDLRPGDIVTAVNGQPVTTEMDFQEKMMENPLELTVFREENTLTITLNAG